MRPGKEGRRKLAGQELFEYAVKCLGIRAFSAGDLRAKLQLRAANAGDVDHVLARLKDLGYLDDRHFAESFAAARVENEGFGRMRLLSDLRARRISGKLAEQAVERAIGERSETELIEAYIERRMPSIAGGATLDERKLASAYRRLRRAGFTSGPILTALKGLAARPDLLEDPPPDEDEIET